ncbi:hypothetical protein AWM70_10030 [Paenibacillus yonginensis]|uniref:DUF2953 domain-containing protein n=1 Tax=Paenibacillus yonginensis TaxID=1462996 RepID=A0A1B1N0D6_9BACL|nr:DUF2953 domain-containing protein [Paenibacillus yonginensis]ANS74894.1 hypothetical protein AWM70_10030 [Paenibacillus yonginensis]
MWTWIWTGLLALAVVLLLLVVLLSKVTIRVHASKQNKDEQITADMKALFGMVNLHYEVPRIVFDNFKQGFKVETAMDSQSPVMSNYKEDAQHIDKEKVQQWKEIYKQILHATEGLKVWTEATLKHLEVTQLAWTTDFAMKEADHTAVASGLLWSVKNFIVGGLSFRVHMKKPPELQVTPGFGSSPHFTTQMDCIAKIGLGYAMYAGLTLITRVLKVKGGTKQWLNILFKA